MWLLGSGLAGLWCQAMGYLHVKPETGLGWKGSLAGTTGQFPLLLVDTSVVVELGGDTEGLSAIVAMVAPYLRMDTAMILQGKKIRVGFEAHGTVVDANGVGVLVVEKRTGMAV